MTDTELAQAMLDWQDAQATADSIKERIEEAVLERGKTQTVGNVRASYSAGRKSYDYETAVLDCVQSGRIASEDLGPFREEVPATIRTDWRVACNKLSIDAPFTKAPARVTVKLIA